MSYGILVDVTKCVGCEKCVAACVEDHGFDKSRAEVDRATTRDGLSAQRLSSLIQVAEGRFARKSCMHCLDPSCVSACLVGAITRTDEGPVVYDASKCIGCRYCMLACPFHIPRYEWSKTTPFVRKCDLCAGKLTAGESPACVDACPEQALVFGKRDELLEQARAIITSRPDRYERHIWGEREFGGTSVLYISDMPLARLDWPDEPMEPIPHLTEGLIETTPIIGLSVASSLLGVNWIIKRRMKMARERNADRPASGGPGTESIDDGE